MTALVGLVALALLGLLWAWDRQPSCPSCGSHAVRPFYRFGGRQFLLCDACRDVWSR